MSTYSANYYIAQYLIGKDFIPTGYDYRYYYFDETEELLLSISQMPQWYLINFGNPWS